MNPTQNTVTLDPTTADVLDRAADHIERHGFNQGTYYDNAAAECPAACTAGAIAIAAYGYPAWIPEYVTGWGHAEYTDAFEWMQGYLAANLDRYAGQSIGVYAWNDSPHTTGMDVVDTLRAAAAAWRVENQGGEV
ncbi:MAG: DUF6197 family protein [Micromonosporaceae bacterium]